MGGPIVKNKLFYYGLFAYNPLGQASAPTSATLTPTAQGYQLLDTIPGLSRTNLDILKQFAEPAPTASTTTSVQGVEIPIGILPISFPNFTNIYNWIGNADWNISDKDRMRFRYIESRQSGIDIGTSPNLPAFANNRAIEQRLFNLSQFHTFSPTLLKELRLSYSRFSDDIPAGDFQFPGLDVFPNIEIRHDLNLQLGPLPEAPQSGTQNSYQVVNNTTWIKGSHNFKFGIDVRRYIAPTIFVQRSRVDYNYSNLDRYLLDLQPDELAQRNVGASTYWGNQWDFFWFVQDEWKLRRNFTLTLGVRHEYKGIDAGDKLQTLNSVSNVPGVLEFNAPKAQKRNFAPRIGLAYSPGNSGNIVFRAGFGMGYDVRCAAFSRSARGKQWQQGAIFSAWADRAGGETMQAVKTQKETPSLELSADQLRQTIEALLRMESELPTDDHQWCELRMVRQVLNRMLLVAEEKGRNACS